MEKGKFTFKHTERDPHNGVMQDIWVSDLGEVMRRRASGQANPDGSSFSVGGERFWLRGKETDPRTGKVQGVYAGDKGTLKRGTFFETIGHDRGQRSAAFSIGKDSPAVADLRARLVKYRNKKVDPLTGATISVPAGEEAEFERKCRLTAYAKRANLDLEKYEDLREATRAISLNNDKAKADLYGMLIEKYCEDNGLDPRDYNDRREAICKLRPALDHIVENGL